MAPFQLFFLLVSLAVFATAWLRGGHTERAGVVILVAAYVAAVMAYPVTLNGFRLGEAVIDVLVLVAFVWLALRRDRWWTFGAAACAALTMVAHAMVLLTPDLQLHHVRADVAARWGIGLLMVVCLAAGVLERWMAGEIAVSQQARWNTPRRSAT
ncbi:MAG: hypothetical protein EON96_06455 [Caulobacteraceae bacterium]|nr:MAG: hypothetical protein EON96_06455 [Caulobacteraceae bacterium]